MYTHVCMCIYIYMFIMYDSNDVCMYVCIYIYMHTYICIHIHTLDSATEQMGVSSFVV